MGKTSHLVSSILRLRLRNASAESNAWINEDIRPLPPSRRKWTSSTYLGWWAIWMMGLSNFQIGSSMVAIGLSVWQTMIVIILGRILIAGTAVLNGHVGAEWHIGFPVFSRVLWGMRGSYMAILLRILLGLVGFAVQSWNGGLCVSGVLSAIFPSYFHLPNTIPESSHVTTSEIVGWIVFLALCVPLIFIRPERAPRVMVVMNGLTLITLLAILIWALVTASGAGPLLSQSSQIPAGSTLGWTMLGGINNVIGSVAPALMSQSDFSRFARRPRDQIWGQVTSFVLLGSIMPLFGCLVSSATERIYGVAIWNPPILIITWLTSGYTARARAAAVFAGMGLTISQLAVVVVDNAYAVGIDLSALFPTFLNIRRGAYLGLALGMAFCPWELLSTATIFLTVISSFTVFFGPICGSQVCEYFLVRRRRIKLSDLYIARPGAIYFYSYGFNWRAYASWVVGWAPLFPGLLHAIKPTISVAPGAANLYNLSFIVGFWISFIVHYMLNAISPPQGLGEVDAIDLFGTFTPEEILTLGIETRPRLDDESQESSIEYIQDRVLKG
ncbi:Nicotinamide riboside transporter 1 [Trichoderma simmonsii]|uniref:Nicotinamide riboside transporter 1 n=1 Tax=Trichoderma simmonsii TaxID=1491479 RepID=A0A8G0LC19_9HYPO|nr:Nicotinamide riboside transporter 1 [Trichoderma simmonsii]